MSGIAQRERFAGWLRASVCCELRDANAAIRGPQAAKRSPNHNNDHTLPHTRVTTEMKRISALHRLACARRPHGFPAHSTPLLNFTRSRPRQAYFSLSTGPQTPSASPPLEATHPAAAPLVAPAALPASATNSDINTTSSSDSSSVEGPRPSWVAMMNDAIDNYRMETAVLYVACDIGSISMAYLLIDALGYAGSADLAVALALSRVVRRVRLPADVAVAAVLAKVYPPLTQVKLTHLFTGKPPEGALAPPPPTSAIGKFLERVRSVADKYGLAFMASQRMVMGLASIGTIYAMMQSGVDVQGWLEAQGLPFAGPVGETAGRYAAAVCVAALMFPVTVLGSGALARVVGRFRRRNM